MSEQPLEKVMDFVRWLASHKARYEEPWTDQDSYAIGIYAIYLAFKAKEGDVHE